MQTEIYSVIYRMVHKYGWNLGLTRGLINRRFGTNYTADELKELYNPLCENEEKQIMMFTGALSYKFFT